MTDGNPFEGIVWGALFTVLAWVVVLAGVWILKGVIQ
jgi:hypothetical protein